MVNNSEQLKKVTQESNYILSLSEAITNVICLYSYKTTKYIFSVLMPLIFVITKDKHE